MRQSGRTTQMLVAAYEAKEFGSVLIISPNGEIRNSVMRIARAHGLFDGVHPLAHSDFTTMHYIMQGKLRGYRGSLFEDHTVREGHPLDVYFQEVDMCKTMNQVQAPKPKTFHFTPF